MKLIVYQGIDEVIVCNPRDEKKILKLYFAKNSG